MNEKHKNSKVSVSGHMAADHVHMCISIPPKLAVSEAIGYLKGKSAIAVARQFGGKQKNFNGENFWARGYAVSTVGFELEKVKEYIAHQEKLETEQEEGRF
jgi:putative transposase